MIRRYAGLFWYRRMWLTRTQWLDIDQIQTLQASLLNKLLKHCYHTVPYYHKLMDDLNISVKYALPLDIIKEFPILTKSDILRVGNDLVSRKYPRWFLHIAHTGGSTGPRLPLRRDFVSIGDEHAFVRRQFEWAGMKMSDRCAYLTWRTVSDPNSKFGNIYAYDPFMRELILSTFHLSLHNIRQYVEAIRRYKVKFLVAYPSSASVLARGVLDQGINIEMKGILTTSEILGDNERQLISRAFHCPVYDFYGGAERVCYIHTCEKGTYHLVPEYGVTECIQASPPNEDCYKVIATGFWNRAMPLIRYDTGDLIKKKKKQSCTCGRHFPEIEKIIGRESRTITTSSGRTLGLTAIGRLFKNVMMQTNALLIHDSQFILNQDGTIVFEYIPRQGFSCAEKTKIMAILQKELPHDLSMQIEQVDQLSRSVSGKAMSLVKE